VSRKIVKLSEIKSNEDFYDDKYICLFPYKYQGIDYERFSSEEEFKTTYPEAYKYLKLNKNELLKRDRGIENGYRWFEFGRTQGLKSYNDTCIVASAINKYPNFIKVNMSDELVRSGLVVYNINYDIDDLLERLNSKEMETYMFTNGNIYGDGWRGYSKKILENYTFNK
jgi:hypothetical protein